VLSKTERFSPKYRQHGTISSSLEISGAFRFRLLEKMRALLNDGESHKK